MQLVHLSDTRHLAQVPADLGQVDTFRAGLKQDVDGFSQQPPGARQDQRADGQRGDRVGQRGSRVTL